MNGYAGNTMIVENVSSIKHIAGPARQKKDGADAVPNICKKFL